MGHAAGRCANVSWLHCERETMGLLLEFPDPHTGCVLVFDDDGRVAWAYLRAPDGEIIGDVWLYNRVEPPLEADFTDPTAAPFLNPAVLAAPLDQPPAESADDLSVEWTLAEGVLTADVFLRETLLARLTPGAQPGWSTLARENGPLARVLPN